MSQTDLADQMARHTGTKYHQQTILRIEKGDRPLKLSEGMTLSKIFGVPLNHITTELSEITRVRDDLRRQLDEATQQAWVLSNRVRGLEQRTSAFETLAAKQAGDAVEPDQVQKALANVASSLSTGDFREHVDFKQVLRDLGIPDDAISLAESRSEAFVGEDESAEGFYVDAEQMVMYLAIEGWLGGNEIEGQ